MSLYNLRNPAVKRLMKEAEELLHPTEEYHAQPLEDNLFEWHFTLKGPPNSDYEGGIYHGRITLPTEYPMKPPSIILLTPNGRFETNKKICLSISGHHPETWQPSWSIRTALLAIIGFMPTHGNGAIGSLDYTHEERQLLAQKSQKWQCPECGYIKDIFSKKASDCLNEDVPSKESLYNSELQDLYQDQSSMYELDDPVSKPWWSSSLSAKRKYVRDLKKKYQCISGNDEMRETWKLIYKKEAVKYKKAIKEAKSKQNEPTEVLPSESNESSSSESNIPKHNLSTDDETSLVQRHKSPPSQDTVVEPAQVKIEHQYNFVFTMCVIFIVSIILFLSLRRLLSL